MSVKIPYETADEKGVNLELEIPEKNLLKIYIPEEPEPVADLGKEVERAIKSRAFERSERARDLLEYLVNQDPAGKSDGIKGFSIAMDVLAKARTLILPLTRWFVFMQGGCGNCFPMNCRFICCPRSLCRWTASP